nr:MAG TPA: hypothetical protein [Bacteriophage sp.]
MVEDPQVGVRDCHSPVQSCPLDKILLHSKFSFFALILRSTNQLESLNESILFNSPSFQIFIQLVFPSCLVLKNLAHTVPLKVLFPPIVSSQLLWTRLLSSI